MKLVSEAVAEVVDSKAKSKDDTTEEAKADEEEYMMAVVEVETEMIEAAGIIHFSGKADQMQEWCSAMMAYRYNFTPLIILYHMSCTNYQRLRISELENKYHVTRGHVKLMTVL